MTSVRDPLRVLHRLPGVGEQPLHLLLALHVILSALVAHPVFIGQLLAGLNTQQDIMGLHIIRIGVMHVVGTDKRNIKLSGHVNKRRVDRGLGRNTVVLQFQKIVALPETFLVF